MPEVLCPLGTVPLEYSLAKVDMYVCKGPASNIYHTDLVWLLC